MQDVGPSSHLVESCVWNMIGSSPTPQMRTPGRHKIWAFQIFDDNLKPNSDRPLVQFLGAHRPYSIFIFVVLFMLEVYMKDIQHKEVLSLISHSGTQTMLRCPEVQLLQSSRVETYQGCHNRCCDMQAIAKFRRGNTSNMNFPVIQR